jgi:hypothetical protein
MHDESGHVNPFPSNMEYLQSPDDLYYLKKLTGCNLEFNGLLFFSPGPIEEEQREVSILHGRKIALNFALYFF